MPPGKQPAPRPLTAAALAAAGRPERWQVIEVASVGRVNTTTIVELGDGERLAVRVHGWPFPEPEVIDRPAKEALLAGVLRRAGVPAAEMLSSVEVDGQRATLMTALPGETLGAVARREAPATLETAWREAGAALAAAHRIGPADLGAGTGSATTGWVTVDGVRPFAEGSHAGRVVATLTDGAERLRRGGLIGAEEARRITALAADGAPAIAGAAPALVHGDANPWNVLIHLDPDEGWRLSGWLDWEFAWLADPHHDLVRAEIQRFAPIGPPPPAWSEGYGSRGDPLRLAVLGVEHLVSRWTLVLDGVDTPETRHAATLLPGLPERLDTVERLLGR